MYRLIFFFTFLFVQSLYAQIRTHPATQPVELGQIAWFRSYDQAIALSKKQGKPVFVLFQEVPVCLTCRNYGKGVLSHPSIVETIERQFIPLAIFNNKGGKDREVLNYYGEPSWNKPVVRIVDANGKDLIDRIAGNYSKKKVASEMIRILEKRKKTIPVTLRNVAKGLSY